MSLTIAISLDGLGNASPIVFRISGRKGCENRPHTDEDKVPLIRGWSVGEKPRGARVGRSHWPCQASWISFEARNLYLTFDWPLAWPQVSGYMMEEGHWLINKETAWSHRLEHRWVE